MTTRLQDIDVRDLGNGQIEIVINFDNDRHHALVLNHGDDKNAVVRKLYNFTDRMHADPFLEE